MAAQNMTSAIRHIVFRSQTNAPNALLCADADIRYQSGTVDKLVGNDRNKSGVNAVLGQKLSRTSRSRVENDLDLAVVLAVKE